MQRQSIKKNFKRKVLKFYLLQFLFLIISIINPKVTMANGEDSIFGKIKPPMGVNLYQIKVGSTDGVQNIGIILFLSNVIRLITVAAGIWVLFNIISAGWLYITSPGDSSATEKVSAKITSSIIGLVIVAMAYTVAGLAGYLIFGNAGFILNPELHSAIN